jgi:thioredoxin reductase
MNEFSPTSTIIGAGPAGIAAAIQLRRHGIDPVIIEKDQIGGLLRNANLVENYPGFPGGISGPDLVALFKKQLDTEPYCFIHEEVQSLDHDGKKFLVKTANDNYHSQFMLVASGTKPKRFNDFEIPEDVVSRVFYEVFPVLEAKGKKIIIVGAGDAAFDYALNLERNNEIMILNRGKSIQCLRLLVERTKKSSAINYQSRTSISKVTEAGNKLMIECNTPDGTTEQKADYLIMAIGREPQLDFLADRLRKKQKKLEAAGKLYFLGDVKNGSYRQTAIAVGDAVMAAMKINRIVNEENK